MRQISIIHPPVVVHDEPPPMIVALARTPLRPRLRFMLHRPVVRTICRFIAKVGELVRPFIRWAIETRFDVDTRGPRGPPVEAR